MLRYLPDNIRPPIVKPNFFIFLNSDLELQENILQIIIVRINYHKKMQKLRNRFFDPSGCMSPLKDIMEWINSIVQSRELLSLRHFSFKEFVIKIIIANILFVLSHIMYIHNSGTELATRIVHTYRSSGGSLGDTRRVRNRTRAATA